jgi:hypothetical protein
MAGSQWMMAILFTVLGASASAGEAQPLVGTVEPPVNALTLEVFIRSDATNSRQAEAFARQLGRKRRGLTVVVRDVLRDMTARQQFWDVARKFAVPDPAVPAFFACNRAAIGFTDAQTSGRRVEELFQIRAFVREGCPHCRDAKKFLAKLGRRWPALRIELLDVAEPAARQRMNDVEARFGAVVTTLPAVEVCNRLVCGYDSEATTGRQIEDLLRQASVPSRGIEDLQRGSSADRSSTNAPAGFQPAASFHLRYSEGTAQSDEPPLPPVAKDERTELAPAPSGRPEGIEVPGWGMLYVDDLGLPAFTVVIGLLDGFNPCAMWVLVFLLSILVNVRNRAKILAIAGTFVLISGLAYFAFMAAWLNVFLLVGYARSMQIALGLLAVLIGIINVKDFIAFKRGISLSIPESAKEGIYARVRQIVTAEYLSTAVALAVVLAISVNVVELLCTAGLPALYTQILTVQGLPTWQNYVYLLLYNLAYMLDDALMLGVFVATLSHRKIQEREGRWLKLISGLVILALGLVMLWRPQWLELTATT